MISTNRRFKKWFTRELLKQYSTDNSKHLFIVVSLMIHSLAVEESRLSTILYLTYQKSVDEFDTREGKTRFRIRAQQQVLIVRTLHFFKIHTFHLSNTSRSQQIRDYVIPNEIGKINNIMTQMVSSGRDDLLSAPVPLTGRSYQIQTGTRVHTIAHWNRTYPGGSVDRLCLAPCSRHWRLASVVRGCNCRCVLARRWSGG